MKKKVTVKISIINWITGSVIYESKKPTLKEAVVEANLYGADLRGAENSELAIAMTRILPEGDIIGWKKCRDTRIVKLLIPAKAKL